MTPDAWATWKTNLAYPADKVTVAYLSDGAEASAFSRSLQDMRDLDRLKGVGRFGGFDDAWRLHLQAGVNIARPRNWAVARFLHLAHQPEWLLMVDGDMSFTADALEVLLAAATPERIVGGLCFAWGPDGGIIPTMFFHDELGRHRPVDPATYIIPKDRLVQVSATGAAFLLVHRDALVAIAKLMPETRHPWFREQETELVDPDTGDTVPYWVSEDLFFCDQATTAGLSIWVHTAVEVKHRKTLWLTRALYESDTSAIERA